MNWPVNLKEKKAVLKSYLKNLSGRFKISGEESPEVLRKKQMMRLCIGSGMALLGAGYITGLFDLTPTQPQEVPKKATEKPIEQRVADLSTPLSSVKDGDIWVSRIEKLVKGSREEMEKIRGENIFLEKKINTLMGVLGGSPEERVKAVQELQSLGASSKTSEGVEQSFHHEQSQVSEPQRFPSVGSTSHSVDGVPDSPYRASSALKDNTFHKRKRKLLHLSNANIFDNSNKPPSTYLPAGTYFKVVTAMGVVVSTGTNSSSDPQPILLRIVDNGNLPGGLKGKVKDAVLIGTCYGSASAERAICRLKTLSWRDKSNRNIEKPVEGWIASEDGVQGIRAKIIDRSSEIAREAFGAGLLSAASNFFKMEATSGVYPMTPFGQTNALSKTDALKAGLGGGVGSAMDKLAEFSIKRAESMSPVAYVASGRVLDAVLMRGVDLSPLVQDKVSLVNSTSEHQTHPEPHGETQ